MSLLTRWGFNRRERTAIIVLTLTLLSGIAVDYFRNQAFHKELNRFSADDSVTVAKLIQFNEKAENLPSDALLNENSEIISQSPPLIDINSASYSELQNLPGIGPVIAQRIVDYRSANGAFSAIDSLINVKGIGKEKMNQLRNLITIQKSRGED